ncbi:OB-fold domain-containing protein [Rhodococcus erythropolis]|uniref:DNA-binding protein n=1 Tax=Rhodococcus erythropolis TaxID=1833 RepID=A0A0C3AEU5_RHOER|nr:MULTISPECIES: OB-fold domain-containing protein [Rhodococcus]AKD95638.1 DNA-binding protein [Rhodococcus erythropolis]KAB2581432.1 DNA-binding protein [Rhodococcus erythropolis]KIM17811.1 DNA-binding protein [Rhodococcus erythropolis]MBO8150046.1 OB-fold domain-containing protein [Rhodococcus erythropolis]MBT1257697.1 OB-fold domain-containing protein [Rhodococcus erythropolis]
MTGPVPVPTPATAPYWEGAQRGELTIQRCESCTQHYFYPRPFCPFCNSDDVVWTSVSGRARLVSYVINHRPIPPFDPTTPIIVALVELDEGPYLMSNVIGVAADPGSLPLDLELEVTFVERGDMKLPMFTPLQESAR